MNCQRCRDPNPLYPLFNKQDTRAVIAALQSPALYARGYFWGYIFNTSKQNHFQTMVTSTLPVPANAPGVNPRWAIAKNRAARRGFFMGGCFNHPLKID
jgi:hypothetical protein